MIDFRAKQDSKAPSDIATREVGRTALARLKFPITTKMKEK